MKKKSIISIVVLALCMIIPFIAKAQSLDKIYGNVDWQLNLPLDNKFADKISGWGAHTEVGYNLTNHLGLGLFLSYHTNNKYVGRETKEIGDGSVLTTDQQHSIFRLPFGAAFRYTFMPGSIFQPYFSAHLGTSYSKVSSDINIFRIQEEKWGFYASPEIGANIFLNRDKTIGLNIATYYSHSTNKSEVFGYSIDGLRNWGIRVGVAF